MGIVWKFDETWPTYSVVVYQEYPVWKFMKRGPWREREGRSLLQVGAYLLVNILASTRARGLELPSCQLENEWRLKPSVGRGLRASKRIG